MSDTQTADAVLLASVDVAREALLTITDGGSIGAPAGHIAHDEHTLSLLFQCTLPGYPGWHWTVTLGRADDTSAPTVLETELMPGENALLAPEWVPWSDRLAEYQAAQEAKDADEASDEDEDEDDDSDEDDDDEVDDDDELDDEDADQLGTLHGGDIDGVDIDEIEDDDSAPVDAEVDESEDSEDDSDDVGPEPGQPVLADEAAAEHDQ